MAAQSLAEAATQGFVERGRSVVSTHVVDVDVAEPATHLEVIVAKGPFGPEVLVQPMQGAHGLFGELYAQIPGAFGAPGACDSTSGPGLSWVSPHPGLQEYLRTHEFGASGLPGGQRGGPHDIDLAWSIQFHALAADQTIVVCQIDGTRPGVVAGALLAVDRLASVTSQTRAAGPENGLHPLRFGHVVGQALSGELLAPPPPAPAVSALEPTPAPEPSALEPTPAPEPSARASVDARVAVAEALGRYEGKRVTVGTISDKKKLSNVLMSVARGVDPDDICGFIDTGVRANGKSGVVFTASSVHFNGIGDRRHYSYGEIDSFALESSAVVLTGIDGSQTKLTTSGQTLAVAEAVVAATGLHV